MIITALFKQHHYSTKNLIRKYLGIRTLPRSRSVQMNDTFNRTGAQRKRKEDRKKERGSEREREREKEREGERIKFFSV